MGEVRFFQYETLQCTEGVEEQGTSSNDLEDRAIYIYQCSNKSDLRSQLTAVHLFVMLIPIAITLMCYFVCVLPSERIRFVQFNRMRRYGLPDVFGFPARGINPKLLSTSLQAAVRRIYFMARRAQTYPKLPPHWAEQYQDTVVDPSAPPGETARCTRKRDMALLQLEALEAAVSDLTTRSPHTIATGSLERGPSETYRSWLPRLWRACAVQVTDLPDMCRAEDVDVVVDAVEELLYTDRQWTDEHFETFNQHLRSVLVLLEHASRATSDPRSQATPAVHQRSQPSSFTAPATDETHPGAGALHSTRRSSPGPQPEGAPPGLWSRLGSRETPEPVEGGAVLSPTRRAREPSEGDGRLLQDANRGPPAPSTGERQVGDDEGDEEAEEEEEEEEDGEEEDWSSDDQSPLRGRR